MPTGIPKRGLAAVALTLAAAVGMSACSGSDASAGPENVLTVAADNFLMSLEAHKHSSEGAVLGPMQHVLEPLVTRNSEDPTQIEPLLASSWYNPDPLTWEFEIQEDATFSNGDPVTAEDAKSSLEAIIDSGGGIAPLLEPINGIEADGKTLTVTTAQQLGTLLNSLTMALIAPADGMAEDDFWLEPYGSGPFVIESFLPDSELALRRNEAYWSDAPAYDELVYKSIPEESARLTALSNGEIDVITGISADAADEVAAFENVTYNSYPSYGYQMVWFNSSREPFTDERVRRAMWHALDIETIVNDLYGDEGIVGRAPIPQTVFGAPEFDQYEYDPELAQELLADAGFPDGFDTSMQWSDASGTGDHALAQTMISYWAEIGVAVEPAPKERAIWSEDLVNLDFDMNIQGNAVATGDADYTLGRLYLCEANRNGYCNPELDELLLEAKAELDPAKREAFYEEASRIIWDEAVGIFPLDGTGAVAYRDRVQDYLPDPGGRHSFASATLSD